MGKRSGCPPGGQLPGRLGVGTQTSRWDDVCAGVHPRPAGTGGWKVRGPARGQAGMHLMATVLGTTQDTIPAARKQVARPSATSRALERDPRAPQAVCVGSCWGRVGKVAGAWCGQHSWHFLGLCRPWTPRLVLAASWPPAGSALRAQPLGLCSWLVSRAQFHSSLELG